MLKKEELKLIQSYVNVFDNSSGEVVLKDLALQCYDTETTMCTPSDALLTACYEGRRSVLLGIRRMIAKGTQ